MPAYAGKGQPTVSAAWRAALWWNATPSYATSAAAPTFREFAQAVPAECVPAPGARSIAIVIPRDLTDGDPAR
jgi:outer membrane receptor protein involved in Fe transport